MIKLIGLLQVPQHGNFSLPLAYNLQIPPASAVEPEPGTVTFCLVEPEPEPELVKKSEP
jgi:hypothetical protein